MKLNQNLKNIKAMFENMDLDTIKSWKTITMVILFIDMFGVYWFLKWKTLGIAFFIVAVAILTIFLLLERKKEILKPIKKEVKKKMDKQEPKEDKEEEEEEEEEPKEESAKESDDPFDFDIGLPSSEEYNKMLESAIGGF